MKTLLVALLLLVVGTGTAFAECAWVVWSHVFKTDTGFEAYDVESAHPTRQECDVAISNAASALKAKGYTVHGGFPGSYEALADKGTTSRRYYCLPDTVDPRGPKK